MMRKARLAIRKVNVALDEDRKFATANPSFGGSEVGS
jgi:hypothetical protein